MRGEDVFPLHCSVRNSGEMTLSWTHPSLFMTMPRTIRQMMGPAVMTKRFGQNPQKPPIISKRAEPRYVLNKFNYLWFPFSHRRDLQTSLQGLLLRDSHHSILDHYRLHDLLHYNRRHPFHKSSEILLMILFLLVRK